MDENNDITKLAINTAGLEAKIYTEDFAGHSVKYRLLNAHEDLETAILTKSYEETSAYPQAVATAVFALSVISIDAVPFYQQISTDCHRACNDRWEKAMIYYTSFISLWYDAYMEHYSELAEEFENLKKK